MKLVIIVIFCPFTPPTKKPVNSKFLKNMPFSSPNNPENHNFEKMKKKKKTPGDIIILQMCTNENHDLWFLRY